MTTDSIQNEADSEAHFLARVRSGVEQKTLVKLVLGKYRGEEPDLKSAVVGLRLIRGEEILSFVYRYRTKDITKNFSLAEGQVIIRRLLGQDFKSAHLFSLTEEVQIEFRRKGKAVLSRHPATRAATPAQGHDREKRRLLDPGRPFLAALGVTHERGQVLPSMTRKWKQINVFLEIFQSALLSSPIAGAARVRVVDFGSGKGYLTFAVHDFLRNTLGREAEVTGIEARPELVKLCGDVALKLGLDRLNFQQGDIGSATPETIEVVMALHACDTATDEAIHRGIRAGAALILCAPCCHKELRPQLRSPPALQPVLRFGVHRGQEAEMVTDSLRALWLEASGYDTQVFEFISLEHTSKNKMILGVRRAAPGAPDGALARIRALKEFYGIREHRLESLLKGSAGKRTREETDPPTSSCRWRP